MRAVDRAFGMRHHAEHIARIVEHARDAPRRSVDAIGITERDAPFALDPVERRRIGEIIAVVMRDGRSEEHTSELQSLMRISYAVFCLKKKTKHNNYNQHNSTT